MSTERDDDLLQRYRAASAELDEHPASSARAAILAATAREVGARPAPAGFKQGPVDAAKVARRQRWPLAAAAVVMLSTLAVMLAIRTNEEMPQFDAPSAPVTSSDQVTPAPPPATSEPAQREQKPIEQVPSAPAVNRQLPSRAERPPAAAKPRDRSFAETDRLKQTTPATDAVADAPAASPPPAPKTSSVARQRAEEAASGAAAPARPLDQADVEARRDAAQAPEPAPSISAPNERRGADEPAAVWLERIIKLRREGRHVEADAEIKRFRERYPQVQIPPEALPR